MYTISEQTRKRFGELRRSRRYEWWAACVRSRVADVLMGMWPADSVTEVEIALFSGIAHTGLSRADLQAANGRFERDASRQWQLCDRIRNAPIDIAQGVEPQALVAERLTGTKLVCG